SFTCLLHRRSISTLFPYTTLFRSNPDRLLYRFYKNAGLPVKDSVYGGWESEGLSGHTMGHYLSACSMMFASTGNNEFTQRVNYIDRKSTRLNSSHQINSYDVFCLK